MNKTTDEILLDLMQELSQRKDCDVAVSKGILIISTPRSGSSLYCEVLSNTGKIGQCLEWFNMRYMGAYAKMKGAANVDFPEYLTFIKNKTSLDTGVFAVNMHVEQYLALLKNNINVLNLGFSSVVYLERKNKIEQAISLVKAQKTDQWAASAKATTDKPLNISNSEVTRALLNLVESHEYFQNNLSSHSHFHYCYEDFKTLHQDSYFLEPLQLAGIEVNQEVNLNTELKVQSNTSSRKTYDSYLTMVVGS